MRVWLQAFCDAVFPVLGQLLQRLVAEPAETPELADLLRVCLKIFWSCIYVDIPVVLIRDMSQARLWLQVRPVAPLVMLAHVR